MPMIKGKNLQLSCLLLEKSYTGEMVLNFADRHFLVDTSCGLSARFRQPSHFESFPDLINRGIDQELENERSENTADHGRGDPAHDVSARTLGPHDGDQAHKHHPNGHYLGTKALHCAVLYRFFKVGHGAHFSLVDAFLVGQIQV